MAARRRKAESAGGVPTATGLDALAACAALLCGEAELPHAGRTPGAGTGRVQVCGCAAFHLSSSGKITFVNERRMPMHKLATGCRLSCAVSMQQLGMSTCPQMLSLQGKPSASKRSSPSGPRAAEVQPPSVPAIRPFATRLPDWAIAHAAAAEAATPRAVPPLWQSPAASIPLPPAPAAFDAQLHFAAADPHGGAFSSLLAARGEPHPTVMLFGTNLRLMAAKPPIESVAPTPAQAAVLQSLEEKIRDLNEVLSYCGELKPLAREELPSTAPLLLAPCCPLVAVSTTRMPASYCCLCRLQMRRQSGLSELTRAEALAPMGPTAGGNIAARRQRTRRHHQIRKPDRGAGGGCRPRCAAADSAECGPDGAVIAARAAARDLGQRLKRTRASACETGAAGQSGCAAAKGGERRSRPAQAGLCRISKSSYAVVTRQRCLRTAAAQLCNSASTPWSPGWQSQVPTCCACRGHEQSCAKCGRTETPTWRRAGKLIFCNACGLKHQPVGDRSEPSTAECLSSAGIAVAPMEAQLAAARQLATDKRDTDSCQQVVRAAADRNALAHDAYEVRPVLWQDIPCCAKEQFQTLLLSDTLHTLSSQTHV